VNERDLAAAPTGRALAPRRLLPFDPVFSILCQAGDIECGLPLRVPGGRRLHLAYAGGRVVAKENGALPRLNGRVLSGSDWLLLREDGVLVFDGRMTLGSGQDLADVDFDSRASRAARLGDNLDAFLVNATLTGMVDLNTARQRGNIPRVQPAGWDGLTCNLSVVLPIRFGASGTRVSWAKPRYRLFAENFATYGLLVQNQFLAIGDIAFSGGLVTGVSLEIGILRGGDE
jgi:hypothetical protein